MEEKLTTKQINNKGFTLIEVLVALAVSGIVVVMIAALMTNGSFLFKNESSKINLQNELQMVDSFLTETVFEAKALYIDNTSSITTMYTGIKGNDNSLSPVVKQPITLEPESEGETNENAGSITTERILTFKNTGGLYITKKYVSNLTKGYLISECVTGFDVTIDDSCKKIDAETSDIYYTNPIILNIKVKVTANDKEKEETYTYKVRNQLESIYINNVKYEVR